MALAALIQFVSGGSYAVCKCLEGFTLRSREEWKALMWSKGCVRKTPLDCRKGGGLGKVAVVKLPDLMEFWFNMLENGLLSHVKGPF